VWHYQALTGFTLIEQIYNCCLWLYTRARQSIVPERKLTLRTSSTLVVRIVRYLYVFLGQVFQIYMYFHFSLTYYIIDILKKKTHVLAGHSFTHILSGRSLTHLFFSERSSITLQGILKVIEAMNESLDHLTISTRSRLNWRPATVLAPPSSRLGKICRNKICWSR
jgi:hypothetical protein